MNIPKAIDRNKFEKPMHYNPLDGLVSGRWYRIKLMNCEMEFWYPHKLKGKELRAAALEFVGSDIYELNDIDSVREIKGG